MAEIKNGVLHATNAEILNTVRRYAPDDYKSRIPEVTQGTVKQAIDALNSYTPDWNVFYNILLNRIGMTLIRERSFTNPLGTLKRGSMRWGTQIQEMQVNLLRAKHYAKDAINVFGIEGREPDIHVKYHTMNRQDKYELVVPMAEPLRGAFTEDTNLAGLLNSIAAQPKNSDENDEFLLFLQLLKHYDDFQGFYNVQVDDIKNAADPAEAGRKLVKAVRAMDTKLKYYSTDYSYEGRNGGLATLTDRSLLIIDADTDASLTVDMLAYMFNEQNGKLIADRIVRVPKLPVAGAQAMLVDQDFFLCADNLGPMTLSGPMNVLNMTQLYVLHHWETLSYSLFANAIMFSTLPDTDVTRLESTVTGVTLKDAEGGTASTIEPTLDLATGYTGLPEVKLVAEVTGVNNPSQAVLWTLKAYDGKGHVKALPADCYVDSMGTFHAGHAKAGAKIRVTATSVQNGQFSADYDVIVEGVKATTALTASPASLTMKVNEAKTITVKTTPADATDPTFTVAVTEGADNVAVALDRNTGIVTVTGVKAGTATLLLVAAGSAADAQVTKTVSVTISAQ